MQYNIAQIIKKKHFEDGDIFMLGPVKCDKKSFKVEVYITGYNFEFYYSFEIISK